MLRAKLKWNHVIKVISSTVDQEIVMDYTAITQGNKSFRRIGKKGGFGAGEQSAYFVSRNVGKIENFRQDIPVQV